MLPNRWCREGPRRNGLSRTNNKHEHNNINDDKDNDISTTHNDINDTNNNDNKHATTNNTYTTTDHNTKHIMIIIIMIPVILMVMHIPTLLPTGPQMVVV